MIFNLQVRTEAVNKLQEIISEARLITNNLGDAVPAISERLTDSNSRLVANTVALCESIAVAMGPSCRTYIRDFFPGMLQRLGDNKVEMVSCSKFKTEKRFLFFSWDYESCRF